MIPSVSKHVMLLLRVGKPGNPLEETTNMWEWENQYSEVLRVMGSHC